MDELSQIVETVAADAAIKGCVVTSGKEAFSGGADLTMLQGLGAQYAKLGAREGRGGGDAASSSRSRASCRCSTGGSRPAASRSRPRSTASASAAPSSSRSPATTASSSDDDATRVGLPEIKVGLFPGAGGTQRVARLMQTGDALQMLFKGEQIRPLMAKNMGLVHEVAPRDEIVEKAKAWINGGGSGGRAVGPAEGFKAALRQGLFAGRHDDLAAGERDLPPRDARQLPGRQGDPAGGLRGPAAADGPRAQGRVALLRQDPALHGSGGDDPHAVRLDAGAQQGRAPARRRAADRRSERSACSAPASWARASPM